MTKKVLCDGMCQISCSEEADCILLDKSGKKVARVCYENHYKPFVQQWSATDYVAVTLEHAEDQCCQASCQSTIKTVFVLKNGPAFTTGCCSKHAAVVEYLKAHDMLVSAKKGRKLPPSLNDVKTPSKSSVKPEPKKSSKKDDSSDDDDMVPSRAVKTDKKTTPAAPAKDSAKIPVKPVSKPAEKTKTPEKNEKTKGEKSKKPAEADDSDTEGGYEKSAFMKDSDDSDKSDNGASSDDNSSRGGDSGSETSDAVSVDSDSGEEKIEIKKNKSPPKTDKDGFIKVAGKTYKKKDGEKKELNIEKKTQLCFFHHLHEENPDKNEECKYGKKCINAHGEKEQKKPSKFNEARPAYRTSMCERVEKGKFCSHGKYCHYAHSEEDLREYSGENDDSYEKDTREFCPAEEENMDENNNVPANCCFYAGLYHGFKNRTVPADLKEKFELASEHFLEFRHSGKHKWCMNYNKVRKDGITRKVIGTGCADPNCQFLHPSDDPANKSKDDTVLPARNHEK